MTSEKWKFRSGEHTIQLEPPSDIDSAVSNALWDFITAEIGESLSNLDHYRERWVSISADPASAAAGIAGNGTLQRIDGDDVVLEALYDQWETVRISKRQFDLFLDQFGEFLRDSGSGS